MTVKKKAIVLFSGGLDSTVSLWWAKSKGWKCHALSFDYGQRHNKELKQARLLAKKAKVPHKIVRFSLPWGGSTLTDKKSRLPHHSASQILSSRIPSTYVPGRNTIFLSFALSWADQREAQAIVIGANAIDYSGYPDCRPPYIKSFETVANRGSKLGSELKKKISIYAPLLKKTKSGIIQMGKKLNVPLHLTWSCYQGGKRPCQKCDSCILRTKGFEKLGLSE